MINRLLTKLSFAVLALIVGALATSSAFASATIVIQNGDPAGVGFNDSTPAAPVGGNNGTTRGEQRLIAFQRAAAIWGQALNSGPTITVRATWEDLTCDSSSGVLGSAGTQGVWRNFPGAPLSNTWYSSALANTFAGTDLDPANAEIRARFNVRIGTPGCLDTRQWYLGLDTNHGSSGINLVTVLLHEFSHGLGFQTFTNSSTTGAMLQGYPSVYDGFLYDNTSQKSWTQMNDSERLASAINTGNLVWTGLNVNSAAASVLTAGRDAQGHPQMWAPNPVAPGSSVSHWERSQTPNQLMEPNISSNLTHNVAAPFDLTSHLFADIGWSVNAPPPPTPTPTPTPSPSPTPTPTPQSNSVQFESNSSTVGEGAGRIDIGVSRTGDTSGSASVKYATSDTSGLTSCKSVTGKSSERCDYQTAVGTLRFAPGEIRKTFSIAIVNDTHIEGSESLTITLSKPSGVLLGSPSSATLTIIDDDSNPSAQNPLDDPQFYITQQYIDFLGRLPDSGGLAGWLATINGCPNNGFGNDNPGCDRVHVSSGFFLSDEFRGRGYWAYRFYEVAFDRRPDYAEFIPDMAEVGGSQSPESEALAKTAYANDFALRSEFSARYDGMTNEQFVTALEQNAEIAPMSKQEFINALTVGSKTRSQVLREIVESAEVENRFYVRAFVAMQYFGYLRRNPDSVGYNNWVSTLTSNPGDFRHMIFGFIYSEEYRTRFGN